MPEPPSKLPPDLQHVLREYDSAIDKLSRSQAELMQRVGELQAELGRKNDLLAHSQRMAVLGELAASIAHEIRNPLGGMRLYLDLLERQLGSGRNTTIENIRRSIARLDRVVRDVLSSAKEIVPQLQRAGFTSTVMEAVSLASAELESKKVAIDVQVDDFEVSFDPDLILRLLLNLILNAAQATDDHGKVFVRAQANGAGTRLTVEDTGPGIPADKLEKLFTPGFSSKGSGTGLGLAICRRIAEAHRGTIRGENRTEGGARFIVEF